MQYDVGIAYHVFLRPWLRKRFAKGRLVNGIIFSHGRQFAVKVPTKLNSCQKSNPLISRPFLNSFTCYLKKILAQNHMHFIQIKALHHMQNIIKTSSKIKDIQLSAHNDMHLASDFRNWYSHTFQIKGRSQTTLTRLGLFYPLPP